MFSFTKHKGSKHFCMHCLNCFYSSENLKKHQKDCIQINGTQAITMPVERSKVYFKNHHKMLPVPFVIYADFEAITEKIDSWLPPNEDSYTKTYQSHKACGFGYKVACHYDKIYSKPAEIYRGEDAIEEFIKEMFEEVSSCKNLMREHFNKPLKMTDEDEKDFENSYSCHICGRKRKRKNLKKPRKT